MEHFSALSDFTPITLCEMDKVKLMDRTDTKYVLSISILNKILSEINNDYYVLEMDNKRVFPYNSLYLDTKDNLMYLAHHNGKLNRYKIRFRKYINTNDTYLEIKYKHKGLKTYKKRIEVADINPDLNDTCIDFIASNTPFDPNSLRPKIFTDFSRITLVSKQLTERVTIDNKLSFYKQKGTEVKLQRNIIIEVKREKASGNSMLVNLLGNYGIYPEGMSKYCMGRALVESNLKSNNFKPKIITLNRIENDRQYYRNNSKSNSCN